MATVYHQGIALTIRITADGTQSINNLVAVHSGNIFKDLAKGNYLIRILADTKRLRSPDQFRQETPGFWAIKAGQVRFYGWFESDHSFVISHAIRKNQNKLSAADLARMTRNQRNFRC